MKDICFLEETNDLVKVPFRVTGMCEGSRNLLQKVVILLFTQLNSYARYQGGDFITCTGNLNAGLNTITAILEISIVNVYNIITSDQTNDSRLSDDEKLSAIKISNTNQINNSEIEIKLDITTAAGNTASVDLTI